MKMKNLLKKAFLLLALVGGASNAWADSTEITADLTKWTVGQGTGGSVVFNEGVAEITVGATKGNSVTLTSDDSYKGVTKVEFTVQLSDRGKMSMALAAGSTTVESSYDGDKKILSLGTLSLSANNKDYTGAVTFETPVTGDVVFTVSQASSSNNKTAKISNVKITYESKNVTSKVLTGININGSAWDISGLSEYAATITTAYNTVPEVEFVYTINYDDDSSDTNQKETVTATKDGDNFVANSTELTNNVTLTFTNVAAKSLPELSYAEAEVAKYTTDANFTNALTNPHDLAVTYSVVDGATATGVEVNASTGEVTIGSVAGTATIKASFAGDETYQAGEASYVLTVTKPTCAEPTYTIGNYNYEEGGYAITPACATDGVTLTWKMSGGSEETACTVGVPFYAKGGKVVLTASKDGWNSNSTTSGNQWTINAAPSETSPEVLLPFGTSNDNSDKNAAHVYKSVTIGEDSNASSVGGSGGGSKSTSLKVRTNQTHDEVANSIMIYVHKGYKVTNLQVSAVSNNKGDGATIDLTGVYVDNKENVIDGFTNTTFPINTADAVTYSTGDIAATDYILMTFDNSNIDATSDKKNNQLVAEFTVTYEETAPTVSATITSAGWATLYTDKALDFSGVEGLTAYTATCSESVVALAPVDNVPANTGVVLKGAEGKYNIPVIASSSTAQGDLKGSATEATAWNAFDGYTLYVLTSVDANVQFNPVKSGSIDAGKAFLKIKGGASSARSMEVVVADDVLTGINEAKSEVKAAKEGKFVVDGQLRIFSKGKMFNANGQLVK